MTQSLPNVEPTRLPGFDDCSRCRQLIALGGPDEPETGVETRNRVRETWKTICWARGWYKRDPWVPFPSFYSDEQLVALGYALRSQDRITSDLDDVEFLELLHGAHQTGEELGSGNDRFSEILRKCGYTNRLGIVDFDMRLGCPSFFTKSADEYVREILALVEKKLNPELERYLGFKLVQPWQTNAYGGVHFHLMGPEDLSDPNLMRTLYSDFCAILNRYSIPHTGTSNGNRGLRSDERDTVPWLVDTGILSKSASGQGGLFRLPYTEKIAGSSAGFKKIPIDWSGTPVNSPIEAQRMNSRKTIEAIMRWNGAQSNGESVAKLEEQNAKRIKASRETFALRASRQPTPEELSIVERYRILRNLWNNQSIYTNNNGGPDRSRRDTRFAAELRRRGVDDATIRALLLALPGGKASDPRVNADDYIDSVLASVDRGEIKIRARAAEASFSAALSTVEAYELPKVRASIFRRILACKKYRARERCNPQDAERPGCGKYTGNSYDVACGHYACPNCGPYYIQKYVAWIEQEWPEEMWLATAEVEDDTVESASQVAASILAAMSRESVSWRVRTVAGPGVVAAISHAEPNDDPPPLSQDLASRWRRVTRTEVMAVVRRILERRYNRIQSYVQSGDYDGLAREGWIGKGKITRKGRSSRKVTGDDGIVRTVEYKNLLPWPTDPEARKAMRKKQQARMTPEQIREAEEASLTACCATSSCWDVCAQGSDVVLMSNYRNAPTLSEIRRKLRLVSSPPS